jgi:hypothetical protein
MDTELLIERFSDQIAGVLSCYDRVIIQGTVPEFCNAQAMTNSSVRASHSHLRLHPGRAAAA